jgi:[pyruvate, water dikinase]-phosphate phosphotransferase / [pyruvate, water dikinase] kinase
MTLRLHLHLISDSTGETVTTVARAAVSQFEDVVPVEHVWFFVRTRAQLEKVLSIIGMMPGMVIFTLISPDLRQLLQERCEQMNVPCVPVLDAVMASLTEMVGSSGMPKIGKQHEMDAGYFSRIAAMDFAMRHDDGQAPDRLDDADVVLVGVSRTSKTPTCVYLANRGIKAANVPIVPDMPQLRYLEKLKRPLVVGLTINADHLTSIRRNRQKHMGVGDEGQYGGDYAESDRVREELVAARRMFRKFGWPEIDVTRRSVEETAAAVLQFLQARREPALASGSKAPIAAADWLQDGD